jgi:hypothetical protein
MKLTSTFAGLPAGLLYAMCFLAADPVKSSAADAKFEAQLIWATNDKKCNDPKLKPVEPEIRGKLSELPLKWENYFEVNRQLCRVHKGGTNSLTLSEKCKVEVKRLGEKKVEVTLHGHKGSVCYTRTQPLPKGEILVLGGNAPNSTAWLVTLKRTE